MTDTTAVHRLRARLEGAGWIKVEQRRKYEIWVAGSEADSFDPQAILVPLKTGAADFQHLMRLAERRLTDADLKRANRQLRAENERLRSAIKEWVRRMNETSPGWYEPPDLTDLLAAQHALHRITEEEA